MFIERISIESFGSLSQVSYDLKSGINIFRGKNESGKSTLAAFIKFIFYGLCGKVPDQSMTEKTRYTNWDNGISGGNLVINEDGKRYRIERRLTPAAKAVGKEVVRIIDLESGAEVHKGKCPGEVFFGVSEDVFSQTAFSAQGSGSVVDSEKMNNAIDNILFSGNESVSVKRALKKLDDARIFLLHKNRKGGKIYTMDQELESIEERIAKAEENEAFLESKSRSLEEAHKQLDVNREQLKLAEDCLVHYEAETVLARFAEADRKKEAFRLAAEEEKRLCAAHTVSGFLPSAAYAAALKNLYDDLGIVESEYASLSTQKDAFALTSLTPEQRSVLHAVEDLGGETQAKKQIRSVTEKRQKRVKLTFLLTLLTAVTAVASVVLGVLGLIPSLDENPFAIWCICGVCGVLLLSTVIVGASLSSLKTKELYGCFAAVSESDALRNLENALLADRMIRDEDSRYARLTEALEACRNRKETLYKKASLLMEKWGLTCTDRASVRAAEEKANETVLLLDKQAHAVRTAQITYESAESALAGFSREEYEALKARTSYVGAVKAESLDDTKRKRAFYSKKGQALEEQIRAAELEIASHSAVTESTDELKDALAELEAQREEYVEKYKAYLLAYEAIRKASENLRARISPALSESASTLMKASTQGRYADIGVDNALAVSFRTDDASPSREVGFMSAGTKALTYISLRLSLIRLLFSDKMPPTVFDEAFSWLDEDRLSSIMALLNAYSQSAQVIVMTCCDREYEACADKASVNLIDIT